MYRTSAINEQVLTALICTVLLVITFIVIPLAAHAQSIICVNGRVVSDDPAQNGGPCTGTANDGVDPAVTAKSATLSNDGIFGCQGQGARVANIGTLTAIGGVYVPVNDAAVTLNTGFLVYKECILDGVARKIAESGTAELGRQALLSFNQGRGGNAQYVKNFETDLEPFRDTIVVNAVTAAQSGRMCNAFKNRVATAYARNYYLATRNGAAAGACTFPGSDTDRQAMVGGSTVVNWQSFNTLARPENNELGSYYIFKEQNEAQLASFDANTREMLAWSNGVFPLYDSTQDPLAMNVLTPGYIIAQSIGQITGSGYRQLETANEIDQVVSNLFGGLTTQLVSDTRGLAGLSQALNGQPSYLDRMVAQTSASVRTQAANAALAIIGAARQIEAAFRQAKEGIATSLSNAITQLRTAENQCWALIIPAVQTYAQTANCTTQPGIGIGAQPLTVCGPPAQLTIATSTQFSQQIIDTQIAPLATSTIQEIRASDASLALLNQLVASVSNSASQSNQQQALLRLDTMVANRQIHTAADANNAATQRDNVVTAVSKLVDDTLKLWGDSTDPNVGWCNVNNPAVIQRWFNAWKQ